MRPPMNALIAVAAVSLSAGSQDKQKVENLIPFDVASCFAPKTSPAPNADGVNAALRSLRPAVIECLLDAKARGGAEATVTLTAEGGKVSVSGVEGAGKACIEKLTSQITLPEKAPKATADIR